MLDRMSIKLHCEQLNKELLTYYLNKLFIDSLTYWNRGFNEGKICQI